MHRVYPIVVFVLALTIIGTISHVSAYQPAPGGAVVELTTNGFNPAVITVTAGTQVTWRNLTDLNYTLQSGSPYPVYLPMLIRGGNQRAISLANLGIMPLETFGGAFPARGQLTYQFASQGSQSYFIVGRPNFNGRVVVIGTTAPTPTQPNVTATNTPLPNATATNTPLPNATATNTPLPNATATNTPLPNATATNTPLPNATATNTPLPDATATNTPLPNATATNTPLPNATATNTSIPTHTATPTPTSSGATPTATPHPLLTSWMMNTTNEAAAYIKTNGASILVNVTSAQSTVINQQNYVLVKSSGIPNYAHTMTSAEVQALNARPKASTDFVTGKTTTSAGQVVKFGQDIGFKSRNTCTVGAGFGYWPPGPECPTNQNKSIYFPLAAQASSTVCKTGLSKIGLTVNGVSVYNWSDGQSYNNQQVWYNSAAVAEAYDVDMCGGHAANGDYHHHFYSKCLAEQIGDTGTGHSKIYGFAADGYPIYGPWQSSGTLAKSCWKPRDYSASSATGCGTANKRTCLLVDQFDPSKGTTPATSAGPDTTATVTSLSGNVFNATSGFYYQDYYYDSTCAAQGGEYLDSHNGHSHDNLGYHYHMTVTQDNSGNLIPAFPYMIGPTFYGTLQSNAATTCSTGQVGPPMPREHDHEH